MLLLKLLSEKDMYGYEMISTLRERSQNFFELKAGSLYPLLHKLEGKNIVASYEKEVLGKVRKYYHITKEGHALLVQMCIRDSCSTVVIAPIGIKSDIITPNKLNAICK